MAVATSLQLSLPPLLVRDDVLPAVVVHPPALEQAKHDINPVHGARHLHKAEEAVGPQDVPDAARAVLQRGRRVHGVAGDDEVLRADELGRGLLLDVVHREAHEGVLLAPGLARLRHQRGRQVREGVLDGQPEPGQQRHEVLGRATRAGTHLQDAEWVLRADSPRICLDATGEAREEVFHSGVRGAVDWPVAVKAGCQLSTLSASEDELDAVRCA